MSVTPRYIIYHNFVTFVERSTIVDDDIEMLDTNQIRMTRLEDKTDISRSHSERETDYESDISRYSQRSTSVLVRKDLKQLLKKSNPQPAATSIPAPKIIQQIYRPEELKRSNITYPC